MFLKKTVQNVACPHTVTQQHETKLKIRTVTSIFTINETRGLCTQVERVVTVGKVLLSPIPVQQSPIFNVSQYGQQMTPLSFS
jgi:hypothetical protein